MLKESKCGLCGLSYDSAAGHLCPTHHSGDRAATAPGWTPEPVTYNPGPVDLVRPSQIAYSQSMIRPVEMQALRNDAGEVIEPEIISMAAAALGVSVTEMQIAIQRIMTARVQLQGDILEVLTGRQSLRYANLPKMPDGYDDAGHGFWHSPLRPEVTSDGPPYTTLVRDTASGEMLSVGAISWETSRGKHWQARELTLRLQGGPIDVMLPAHMTDFAIIESDRRGGFAQTHEVCYDDLAVKPVRLVATGKYGAAFALYSEDGRMAANVTYARWSLDFKRGNRPRLDLEYGKETPEFLASLNKGETPGQWYLLATR
jgi:hypothetical protein